MNVAMEGSQFLNNYKMFDIHSDRRHKLKDYESTLAVRLAVSCAVNTRYTRD